MNKTDRLVSLDALRGFDMFWIAGGSGLIKGLSLATGWGFFHWFEMQMKHAPWEGFTFMDMVFPLFLLIAGVSFPFSIKSRYARGATKSTIYKHMLIRLGILILLGLIYNGLLSWDFTNLRYASVLARIGIAWFFGALIYMNCSLRWQIIWFWIFLLGYWAMMALIPVPGYSAGVFTVDGNLAGYIDRLLLPGIKYFKVMDPEGLLSHIPAISTALLGIFAGQLLLSESPKLSKLRKGIILFLSGIVCMGIGALWGMVFPIIKNLWTSSFVFYAGGVSLVFLSIFYLIIDVWGFKKWAFPFVVIGLNSITIYMTQQGLVNLSSSRDYLFRGFVELSAENWQPLVNSLGYVVCMWLFLYFLYKKKVFLKI